MPLEVPRWWWIGFLVGLVLLASGGALNAVESGMRDNYVTDGCGFPWAGQRPADEQPDDVDCSGQWLNRGIVDALSRATFGPGVAIAILAGVYLFGAAISMLVGGRSEDPGGKQPPGEEDSDPEDVQGRDAA